MSATESLSKQLCLDCLGVQIGLNKHINKSYSYSITYSSDYKSCDKCGSYEQHPIKISFFYTPNKKFNKKNSIKKNYE